MKTFPSPARLFLACAALLLAAPAGQAADKPDGDWKWTFTPPGGDPIESKLKLKTEGQKLSGTLTVRDRQTPITGDFKDGTISFTVTRERNGQKFYSKHEGKFDNDMIKGKIESNFGGEVRTRDWLAKRDTGLPDVTGTWRYTLTTASGQTFEPRVRLKQEGAAVSGLVIFNEYESPISDGKVQGDELSFKVIRERDGQTYTSKYQGKISGNTIKGKIDSDWGGQDRTYDWDARRSRE